MNLIHILTEFYVMLASRATRMGLDLTDSDYTIYFQWEDPLGWQIYSFKPNRLIRIDYKEW